MRTRKYGETPLYEHKLICSTISTAAGTIFDTTAMFCSSRSKISPLQERNTNDRLLFWCCRGHHAARYHTAGFFHRKPHADVIDKNITAGWSSKTFLFPTCHIAGQTCKKYEHLPLRPSV